jgi:hypothetical protein
MKHPSSLDESCVTPSPSAFDLSNLLADFLGGFDEKRIVNSFPDAVTSFDTIKPSLQPVTGFSETPSWVAVSQFLGTYLSR